MLAADLSKREARKMNGSLKGFFSVHSFEREIVMVVVEYVSGRTNGPLEIDMMR